MTPAENLDPTTVSMNPSPWPSSRVPLPPTSLHQSNEHDVGACAKQVLREVSTLDTEGELAKLILNMYERIHSGATLSHLRRAADEVKDSTLKPIV